MTLGDYIWAALNLPHLRAYGIAHGAVMCLCFGLVIGWRTGRIAAGALAGPIIGVVAALVFYALAGPLRYVALLPGWMTFWILFAFLQALALAFGITGARRRPRAHRVRPFRSRVRGHLGYLDAWLAGLSRQLRRMVRGLSAGLSTALLEAEETMNYELRTMNMKDELGIPILS